MISLYIIHNPRNLECIYTKTKNLKKLNLVYTKPEKLQIFIHPFLIFICICG